VSPIDIRDTRWMTPALCCITLKILATKTFTHLSRAAWRTGLMVNGACLPLREFFLRGMTRVNSDPGLTRRKIEVSL